MQPSDLVLRFVTSIGSKAESDYYLSLFRSARPESFAIISVAEAVVKGALEALVLDLRFLSQLGLTPVVVFGLLRPGSGERHAHLVAERLPDGVDGRVVAPEGAAAVARAGGIPLIPLAGAPDVAYASLRDTITQLGSRKLVFLELRSGLQAAGGVPSIVDCTVEYDALVGELPTSQAEILRLSRELLAEVSHRMTIAVTSPLDLLRELFTVRGAGTLIRRGSVVQRFRGLGGVDPERLNALVESAFGRPLRDDFWQRPIEHCFIADDYRGAALVADTAIGGYLSKFAIDQGARGEGIGRDLWRALRELEGPLFWRSRADNPISAWYVEQCHGMARSGPWQIFWRDLPITRISDAIVWARDAPVDFTS